MMSVFKKLIRNELGDNKYNRYFQYLQDGFRSKNLENKEVYEDIYKELKDSDIESIAHRHDRLNETMLLAFRINKTYVYSFIAYVICSSVLIARNMPTIVAVPALLALGVAFLYKTYEYVVNKYCFIDAQMVLVYKAVLEHIIIGHVKEI